MDYELLIFFINRLEKMNILYNLGKGWLFVLRAFSMENQDIATANFVANTYQLLLLKHWNNANDHSPFEKKAVEDVYNLWGI